MFSVYTPFHEDGDISQARKAGEAIANAFIVIGVVLVLTIVLVLLYKFRCYCVSIFVLQQMTMYSVVQNLRLLPRDTYVCKILSNKDYF